MQKRKDQDRTFPKLHALCQAYVETEKSSANVSVFACAPLLIRGRLASLPLARALDEHDHAPDDERGQPKQ